MTIKELITKLQETADFSAEGDKTPVHLFINNEYLCDIDSMRFNKHRDKQFGSILIEGITDEIDY